MPKPAHTRITYSGVIGSVSAPVETWSFSLAHTPQGMDGAGDQVTADSRAGALAGQWLHIDQHMPTDVVLTQVRVARIGADGKTVKRADGSYDQGIWTGTSPGTQATQGMPLQVALCVSLLSDRAGATGKGRFFLPWPALSLDHATKRIPSEQLSPVVTSLVAFINGTEDQTGGNTVIASGAASVLTAVNAIKVGRVPDTLRSRREDVAEGYIRLPLV